MVDDDNWILRNDKIKTSLQCRIEIKIWSGIKEVAIREKMLKWKGTMLECKQILCNIRCTYTLSSNKVVTSKIIK